MLLGSSAPAKGMRATGSDGGGSRMKPFRDVSGLGSRVPFADALQQSVSWGHKQCPCQWKLMLLLKGEFRWM